MNQHFKAKSITWLQYVSGIDIPMQACAELVKNNNTNRSKIIIIHNIMPIWYYIITIFKTFSITNNIYDSL